MNSHDAARRPSPAGPFLPGLDRASPHLAGAAGALVCRHAFDAGWVTRIGTSRAVLVTSIGQRALRDQLGLPDEVLATAVAQ